MAKLESFLFMDQICSAQDTMGTTVLVLSDAAWMWSVQHLSVVFLWILLRQLSYYAIFYQAFLIEMQKEPCTFSLSHISPWSRAQ